VAGVVVHLRVVEGHESSRDQHGACGKIYN
jgi:hypothetical protein